MPELAAVRVVKDMRVAKTIKPVEIWSEQALKEKLGVSADEFVKRTSPRRLVWIRGVRHFAVSLSTWNYTVIRREPSELELIPK